MGRRAWVAGVWLAAASAQAVVPGGYREERLSNGMLVSVLPDATRPVVATQLWIHAGSALEAEGSRGLAHLFEHLMFGGTAAYPRGAYERLVHRHGGFENAYTSPDETVYHSEIAPEGHLELLAIEADRMRELEVTAENLENEKRIVLEELRLRTENDPLARALVAAQRRLLGAHPYAFDAPGEKEDVEKASLEAARSFRSAHYRPERAHLVVVGPVDPERVLAVARERFGAWEPGAVPQPSVPALTGWSFPREVDVREDLPPVEVAIVGVPLPPADHPDAAAVAVLVELLSGGPFDRFREELVVRRGRALEGGTVVLRLRRGGVL
ncbi:MAG: insulinase family protein, partial [Thermoanaerobaculia bacterium]